MAEITERQIDILKHATAWPKLYRNHFCTGPGSDDYADCNALVNEGLMDADRVDWIPDDLFTVTAKGKAFLEGLDCGPQHSE